MARLRSGIVQQWTDETTGLTCLIRSGGGGVLGGSGLCGYVGIDTSHPWHGRDYWSEDFDMDDLVSVHGGVTFADRMDDTGELWWIGFDTAHFCSGYWSVDDVRRECTDLAAQLSKQAS